MPTIDRAREQCRKGWHDDPDNSGLCIHCALILDPEPGEDPNSYRRSQGWDDVPTEAEPTEAQIDAELRFQHFNED